MCDTCSFVATAASRYDFRYHLPADFNKNLFISESILYFEYAQNGKENQLHRPVNSIRLID